MPFRNGITSFYYTSTKHLPPVIVKMTGKLSDSDVREICSKYISREQIVFV